MQPVDFPFKTHDIGKPVDATDDQCSSLSVYVGIEQNGHEAWPVITSCWEPSEGEFQEFLRERKIWLHVYSRQMVPVSLRTSNPFT
jgi:hypothetical protein